MNLDAIKQTVDLLVWFNGFVVWIVFIPQMKLLFSVKDSKSISLWTASLSWFLQVIILLQAFLYENWPLVFSMGISLLFLTLLIGIIYYYRRFPGGRMTS
ncbi:MAG: hypothetical protein G01um101456_457 [Parcubacteria group bacterium Gr01-1014_56]|nr:MAG: hypothetical protein G01um101456_457 [Parcubacteria group bacterium Gr01-1014_56]